MSLITDELVRAVHTATPCRRNASAKRAENVLSSYRFCRIVVRAVPRVFVCVACPGRSGRPARIPGIVTIPRATGEPDEVGNEDRRLSGDKGLGGTCAVDVG
jgi:hypothetical protein